MANFVEIKDLNLVETIDDDTASKIVGGATKVIPVAVNEFAGDYFLSFITKDEDSVCLGAAKLEIDEFGGYVIAGVQKDLLCLDY